jgi:hypothetical protein
VETAVKTTQIASVFLFLDSAENVPVSSHSSLGGSPPAGGACGDGFRMIA